MKYKVGDKVRVRKDLKIGERYYMEDASDHDSFVEGMDDLRGKIVTIKSCNGTYRIEERHFNWVDEMFEGLANQKKIVITTDGKETLARLYEDGKVVKTASAKCSPSDEFDFETGARIAFNRLVGEPVKSDEPKIEIGKKYKLKDYKDVKDHLGITRDAWNLICKKAVVPKERMNSGNYFTKCDFLDAPFIIPPEAFAGEWVEPKFAPHMYLLGVDSLDYGLLGYPTRYKDAVGQALFVGDTVTLFKDGEDRGEHAIVRYDGKTFVMGIEVSCDDKIGKINEGWQIVKKRSYKDVGDGEEVSNVVYKKSAK